MDKNKQAAIFVGRMNPIHTGHEKVIQEMIKDFGFENTILVIGSSNNKLSLRNYFSYQERRDFVKTIFPKLKIIGLPDYPTDQEWLLALDDLLKTIGFNPKKSLYFGGCEEDIFYFIKDQRKCKLINRFDGTSVKISSTEIRDSLIFNRPLNNLINPKIEEKVRILFKEKWEKFKKM